MMGSSGLQKVDYTYNPAPALATDYLGGFQYVSGGLQFFPTAEGYVKYTEEVRNPFDYVFNYTDHLGNIRLSYGINPDTGLLKKMEENNYYPFGLKHATYNTEEIIIVPRKKPGIPEPETGRFGKFMIQKEETIIMKIPILDIDPPIDDTPIAENSGYNYKYNGKEYQDELGLNLYAMDFRQYDPAIARFTSIDPIVHYRQSTYTAFNNNPIYWSDPSGLSGEHYDWDTGKYVNDKGAEVSFETALASQGLNADGSEKSNNENEASETENTDDKGKSDDIKFPNGDYEKKYPRLTKAVGQIYDYVKENKDVLYYLSYYSGYSTMEVLNQLEYGNGVTLLAEIMDTEYGETPISGTGIKVNLKWVNGLETAKLNETIQGTSFLIIATILHEFVHYGRIKNGLDRAYEYGWGFERDAFGESVEKGNANDLYKKNGWKLKY